MEGTAPGVSHSSVRLITSRFAGHVQRMGAMRNGYNILVGKREGKRPREKT
jgi:hypothetical protein